jgi:hypothetical protein
MRILNCSRLKVMKDQSHQILQYESTLSKNNSEMQYTIKHIIWPFAPSRNDNLSHLLSLLFSYLPTSFIRRAPVQTKTWYLFELQTKSYSSTFFDIYKSVHLQYVPKVQPTRCYVTQFIYFSKMLYMFQAVPLLIIRSSNCTCSFWYLSNCNGIFNKLLLIILLQFDKYRSCMYNLSSWWWAEEPPETCRAFYFIEINKLSNVASCWLHFGNVIDFHLGSCQLNAFNLLKVPWEVYRVFSKWDYRNTNWCKA